MNKTEKLDSLITKLQFEFDKARKRGWKQIYLFVDLHDTVLEPSYHGGDISRKCFEGAIECLQEFSKRKDVILVLYTSSKEDHIEEYRKFFAQFGIHFTYVNENPDQENTAYADFAKKPYMNLILDDKAGFDPKTHWKLLLDAIREIPELTGPKPSFLVASTVMRIQSPEGPHVGHMQVIRELFESGKKVFIFLSCDRSFPSKKNPLSFELRKKLLEQAIIAEGYGDRHYEIIALRNRRYNDVWVSELEKAIATHLQKPDLGADQVALFHGRDGFGKHYIPTGKYPVFEVGEVKGVNATAIRERVLSHNAASGSRSEGAVDQQLRQPDALLFMQVRAVIKNPEGKIAIVKYASGDERKFRFLGGYVSPTKDVSFESGLSRKLSKKFGITSNDSVSYVGNVAIEDWRHVEAGFKTRGMVYEMQVTQLSDAYDYRAMQIEEVRFVNREELTALIDDEEQAIISLIK